MPDEALAGGRFAAPIRDGDTVTRHTGPGARNVHALLEHIATQGFDRAPRPVRPTGWPYAETKRF